MVKTGKGKLWLVGGVLILVALLSTRGKLPSKLPSTNPPKLEQPQMAFKVVRGRSGFISSIVPIVQHVQRRTGIPASVMIAQAIRESAWGESEEALVENYLGFKAAGKPVGMFWDGKSKIFNASEGGTAAFCVYQSAWHCFMHYAQHIHSSQRYVQALYFLDNPERYADEIGKAGYAGSNTYGQRVFADVEKYGLRQYDQAPKLWRLDPSIVQSAWLEYWKKRGSG